MEATAAFRRATQAAFGPMLDFALPPRCPGCGTVVDGDHRFCMSCWNQIEFLGVAACMQCAMPLPFVEAGETPCAACLAHPPSFDRAHAATAYGALTRQVALKLKYGLKPATAITMAKLMARHVRARPEAVLVPVPLHRWRVWRRGYNQSALIASALARQTDVVADLDALRRTRATPPLKAMNPSKRREAVRGAFVVPDSATHRIRGRDVLLVDDVYTTGSTADACAKALKKAGASSVELHVWARVVRAAHAQD